MTSRRADNGTPKRPRSVLRRVVETLVIVGIVVGLDVLLVYALFPFGSTSEVVWSEYAAADNQDIDTVIVGSSTGQRCIDPNVLDGALGTSTFSLATPAQPIENTYLSVSEAISSHHVRRVIMGVDYETMSLDPWDKGTVTFVQAKAAHESLPKAIGDYAWLLTMPGFPSTTKFLEVLFPWTLAHVKGGVGSIADNVRMRLDGTTTIEAARSATLPDLRRQGVRQLQLPAGYEQGREAMSPTQHGIADFTDANMATLQKIVDLCRENDVQLVVVATPRPAFNVLCYGEKYPEQMARMRDAVESGVACISTQTSSRPAITRRRQRTLPMASTLMPPARRASRQSLRITWGALMLARTSRGCPTRMTTGPSTWRQSTTSRR